MVVLLLGKARLQERRRLASWSHAFSDPSIRDRYSRARVRDDAGLHSATAVG